jgi:hypothetical protein
MSDWEREAFEYDRLGALYATPCIRESEELSLMACVDVPGLKAALNRILFPTWSNMEDARVAGPKWLVVVLSGHLGEEMAAKVAVDPNNAMTEKTRVYFACDQSRP